ncbi:hypothetical protein [Streptobacillus moniliformis]|nr:hypothetical protein [Streptobacillus moniliformis]QXW65422.1 hypothetical protein KX935_06455 [Streptobacillus moniliformis]
MLTIEARKKAGETIDDSNISELKTKLEELKKKNEIVSKATEIEKISTDGVDYNNNNTFDM